MWGKEMIIMLAEGTADTLYMTLMSTLFGYVLGLPMGILLAVTDKEGIRPNRLIYKVLDFVANLVRSIPFLILPKLPVVPTPRESFLFLLLSDHENARFRISVHACSSLYAPA